MHRRLYPWIAALLCALLGACATAPPVQEMSDARQAIAVAEEAGASRFASELLAEAQARLRDAEKYLSQGDTTTNWSFARRNALAAKEIAFDALLRSREAKELEASR